LVSYKKWLSTGQLIRKNFCGACGIYQGKIKEAVENLLNVIRAYGFDKIMPELVKWEPTLQHYPEFESVMSGLVKLFGECPGCAAGGGDPNCAVRSCAQKKKYATCAKCDSMETCEKVQRYGSKALEGLRKIKSVGIDKWIKEMQNKVDSGYCYLDERI